MNVWLWWGRYSLYIISTPFDLYYYYFDAIGVILWNLPNSKAAGVSYCGYFYILGALCVYSIHWLLLSLCNSFVFSGHFYFSLWLLLLFIVLCIRLFTWVVYVSSPLSTCAAAALHLCMRVYACMHYLGSRHYALCVYMSCWVVKL